MFDYFFGLILFFLVSHMVQAACPTWPTNERFSLNGAEATDKHTGLVWARCSIGQTWGSGTCTGNVSAMTHEAALVYSQSQSGWRLPNIKEIMILSDKGCGGPSIDVGAFPNTPQGIYYWSSTPVVNDSRYVFVNHSSTGSTRYAFRTSSGIAVRLVRTSAENSAVPNSGNPVTTPNAPAAPL